MRARKTYFEPLFLLLILALVLTGCATPAAQAEPGSFPTPTTSPRFDNQGSQGLIQVDRLPVEQIAVPTVANLFLEEDQDENPIATATPSKAQESSNPVPTPAYKTFPIYQEGLDQNWAIQRTTDVDVDLFSEQVTHSGKTSLAMTPKQGGNLLLFTVKENASATYARNEILGLSFWLNSGDEGLEPDELAVTVLGSNAYSYWVADDNSVKNVIEPVFSETRLYYLGVNRSIPPNTWVQVELWLNERVYDPDYLYVTGFYIKTDTTVLHTLYIDDVELISVEDTQAEESDSSPGILSGLSNPEDGARNAQLNTLWTVQVDVNQAVHPISPLIYGVTTAGEDYIESLQLSLNSWGGNPSTRFNWKIGHAWNAGRDYFFKNGNYGVTSGSASDQFVEKTLEKGAEIRLAVPTLGWVAKNDDLDTCSFPLPNGECSDVPEAKCENPTIIADPNRANTPSDAQSIQDWMRHLFEEKGFDIRFIAMDNEPELWGYTHYDVHPDCTTYQEILDKYLEYATAIREVVPQAELTGPVTCCWYYYWNSAAGDRDKAAHGNQDFLPWFLDSVRQHDEETGIKTLDVLDIHYYPQNLYNAEVDPETAALRLRSTRSLWDPSYTDESWINQPVYLIPRMQQLIEEHYPGIRLGISEWNWGAEMEMNGALAIADILGIFGREELYFASYFSYPPQDSPGYYAFKMYTNFDDLGGRFGDTSVWTQSTDFDAVSSFAALDSNTGNLHLMLINKQPSTEVPLQVYLNGFVPKDTADRFQYSEDYLDAITESKVDVPSDRFEIALPPYSITLLVMQPE
ncbi:MAG: glycoside hydrolase family 44 protein [Anaerolineales bacterium]